MHFLVFQHADVEHPGSFRDVWRAAGHTWTAVELDEGEPIPDDLGSYDALVVMGGPMDVWQTDLHPWLVPEMAAIRHAVRDLNMPYFGLCLGHQLLAAALGGEVGPAKTPEVGVLSVDFTEAGKADPLLDGLVAPLTVLQWHSAEVIAAPDGASVLARTEACPVQAIRLGAHAYGLQFHAEMTEETVPEWCAIPEYAGALDKQFGPGGAERLKRETAERLPDFLQISQTIGTNWLKIVGAAA